MHWLAVLVLCGTVLLGACRTNEAEPNPALATSTVVPATTATTQPTTSAAALDLSAPPTPAQLQDPAYWNAILATLNHVAASAIRSAAGKRAVEPSAVESLRQVFGEEVFPTQYRSLVDIAAGKDNGLLLPPGDPVARTTRIVKIADKCVGLTATLDYQTVNPNIPTSAVVVELRPAEIRKGSFNLTPWRIERQFTMAEQSDTDLLCSG